jgi:hypothetical protein
MLYYLKLIPLPTNNSLLNNYLSGFNTGFNYYKLSTKVDYDRQPTHSARATPLCLVSPPQARA